MKNKRPSNTHPKSQSLYSHGKSNPNNPMKIIRILFILLALLATPRSWAAGTAVSGIVDGETWVAAGSPYSVGGNVIVSSLVIQPGVEVQFQGNYEFRVEGRLQVNGTAVSPVKFTSTNGAVGWQGILFFDSLPGSYFANCTIENAKNSAVRINNTQPAGGGVPAFTNCTILNNSSPSSGGGIAANATSGDLIFENCVIQNNTSVGHGGGINAELENGTLKMIQCTVVSNIANVALTFGHWVGGGVRVTGDSILLNCVISDNVCNGHFRYNTACGYSSGGGLYSETGNAVLRNCRFERNIAQTLSEGQPDCSYARGGAIFFNDGRLTMQNCIVATNSCRMAINDNPGSGIYVSSGTADIINCTIVANNTHGIYRQTGTVNCINSVLYYNDGNATQISGTVNVTYSDIQGGYAGDGNLSVSPSLRPGTLTLLSASPLIAAGNPDPAYNDTYFVGEYSRGAARNDMGAYGGPFAAFWLQPSVVNIAPVLPLQTNRTIAELTQLVVTNTATDTNIPANTLTYSLLTNPPNATIDASGIIRWTPTEAQGRSTNVFTTKVTDNGLPNLSATNSFTVIVTEVNSAPVLIGATATNVWGCFELTDREIGEQ